MRRKENVVETFFAAAIAAIIVAIGTMCTLGETWQRRTDQAFVSPNERGRARPWKYAPLNANRRDHCQLDDESRSCVADV